MIYLPKLVYWSPKLPKDITGCVGSKSKKLLEKQVGQTILISSVLILVFFLNDTKYYTYGKSLAQINL